MSIRSLPIKPFELKLYAGTPANPVVFDRPGIAVLGCNIHDNMTAWVVVVETPYYGRSAADGVATLTDVPDGELPAARLARGVAGRCAGFGPAAGRRGGDDGGHGALRRASPVSHAQRLRQGLARVGRGGLATRIVALSLLLLLLVQAAGFFVVRSSIDRNAHAQLTSELQVGERVWQRLLDTNAQRLRQAAMLLSADYGFRAAAASGDTATIGSALDNQGARIGATVVALLDTRFVPLALHASGAEQMAVRRLVRDIAMPLSRDDAGSGIALVDGRPLQFVVVPLRAPLTIGWVVMGFPLSQALVDDMHALSGLHVAVWSERANAPPMLAATTLGASASAALLRHGLAATDSLVLDGDEFSVRTVEKLAAGGTLHTALLRSVAEVAAPFREVQMVLAAITLIGVALFALGSAWTAHRVTTPLRSLVTASERLGRGEYGAPMQGTERGDEIGELARAFDHMRLGIAANEVEIRRLAYTDRLTGMPNRARFRDAVHGAISQPAEAAERSVAVVMLDLDRFKHVNDVLGYALGDRLLKAVAHRLTTEVVRDGDIVARLGGDEFALLLPCADAEAALAVARRIAASFDRPLTLDDQTVDLSAGVGIACWPAHAADADTLLVHAEAAMYGAKRRHEAALVYDPRAGLVRRAHAVAALGAAAGRRRRRAAPGAAAEDRPGQRRPGRSRGPGALAAPAARPARADAVHSLRRADRLHPLDHAVDLRGGSPAVARSAGARRAAHLGQPVDTRPAGHRLAAEAERDPAAPRRARKRLLPRDHRERDHGRPGARGDDAGAR